MIRNLLAATAFCLVSLPVFADDRATVERLYTDVFSAGSGPGMSAVVAEVLAPNWVSHGDYTTEVNTPEKMIALMQGLGASVPDLNLAIEEIIVEGNRYVVRGRMTGTPTGDFFGVAPTGKSFEIMTIDIHTVEGGRIVESYHVEDWAGAIRQLTTP